MHESKDIPIAAIRLPQLTLRSLDQEVVLGLQKSISSNGLLQPILVRPLGSSYELIFGRHRLKACEKLGWKSIPAIIKEMPREDCFLTMIVENLQRNTVMNPINEAEGYIALIDNGWTISRIADRIGKSDSYVSDRIGLIRRLHPKIAEKFNQGGKYLRPSHLEVLAHLKSKEQQLELSFLIERRHLSVRKLEHMIANGHPLRGVVEGKGNSLYVKLPQKIAELSNLQAGDTVCISIQKRGRIIMERALQPKEVFTDNSKVPAVLSI